MRSACLASFMGKQMVAAASEERIRAHFSENLPFSCQNSLPVVEHTSYSLDLAKSDFFFIPLSQERAQRTSTLWRRRNKEENDTLKSIRKEEFPVYYDQ